MSEEVVTCDKQCKIKGHESVEPELVLTPEGRHYGRWNCRICGKFITWSKSPKVSGEMDERTETILDMFSRYPAMPREDGRKLCEILRQGTMNYKYRDMFETLKSRYGPVKIERVVLKKRATNP